MTNKALSEALTMALGFEKKGRKLYEEVSASTSNEIVKRTFSYLARQEDFHVQEIRKYMDGKGIELSGDGQHETRQFFMATIEEYRQKASLSHDDITAHETALELERQSHNFYHQQYLVAKEPEIKQFFEFLMKQEKAHYELLDKTLQYIRDPVSFFQKSEDSIFEGG